MQEHLEDQAADARAILSERKAVLDDADTIATHAQDMSDYLKKSELTERKAFIETIVKEIVVTPCSATRYRCLSIATCLAKSPKTWTFPARFCDR